MPSPSPGTDPFLEAPTIFSDLHDSAVTYLREIVQARLPEGYYAALGSRIYIDESRGYVTPDAGILRHGNGARSDVPKAAAAVAIATRSRPVVLRVVTEEVRESFVEIYTRDGRRLVTVIEILSRRNKTA